MLVAMTAIFIFLFVATLAFTGALSAYLSFYKLKTNNTFIKGTVFTLNFAVLTLTVLVFETLVIWP